MIKKRTAELFFTPENEKFRFLPEGPLPLDPATWPEKGNWMAWVAIQHGQQSTTGSLNILNLDTRENKNIALPGRPGFVAETNIPGLLMVGMEREIVLVDCENAESAVTHTSMQITPNPHTIINDGISTPFGAIFGSKDTRFEEPIAHLYLYRNGESQLHCIQANQTCSNGKVILPDEDTWTLFDIDTPTKKVVRYRVEVDSTCLTGPEDFIDLSGEDHFPDGMRITPDGKSMVIAFYNPNDVPFGIARQYNLKDGAVEAEWQVPKAPRVTCPTFIQIDGEVKLMLTTAIEGMEEDQLAKHEHSGCLFLAECDFDTPGPYTPKVDVRHFIASV